MQFNPQATKAAYYLYGLEAGLLTETDAKEWAFSEIAAADNPPIGIIEIASSKGREQLWESLKGIMGNADVSLAGRQLLSLLRQQLKNTEVSHLHWVARKAMQIARATAQPDDIYYSFDMIDDEIFLAVNEKYGTLKRCRAALEEELDRYAIQKEESET